AAWWPRRATTNRGSVRRSRISSRTTTPPCRPNFPNTKNTDRSSLNSSATQTREHGSMSQTIHVAHSPDSDDAFMFYALAEGKIETGNLQYVHQLADIETLNQRALRKELEVTAVSIHAYAYLWRDYALLSSGSSMGDGYGPRLVSRSPAPQDPRSALERRRVAIPGKLTTANLALQLYQRGCVTEVLPFDQIEEAVERGEVEVGLLIHEGQLTFGDSGLHLWADLGAWWLEETGLPLPLGGN